MPAKVLPNEGFFSNVRPPLRLSANVLLGRCPSSVGPALVGLPVAPAPAPYRCGGRPPESCPARSSRFHAGLAPALWSGRSVFLPNAGFAPPNDFFPPSFFHALGFPACPRNAGFSGGSESSNFTLDSDFAFAVRSVPSAALRSNVSSCSSSSRSFPGSWSSTSGP